MDPKTRDIVYPKGFLIGLFIVATLGLIGGCAVIHLGLRSLALQVSDELISEAVAITRELNIVRVKALSFTKADRSRVEYQRLSQQLQAYGAFAGDSSLFTVALRNGEFVFGPGNLRGGDGLVIPPGTIYVNPPEDLSRVFLNRQPSVSKPHKDMSGETVVSAWVPVMDHRSDEVVAALGLSVKVHGWSRRAFRLWGSAGAFGVSLVGCVLVAFWLFGKRRKLPPRVQRKIGLAEVGLVVLVGFIFTFTLGRMANSVERHARWSGFQVYARSQARDVSRFLSGLRTRLDALALLLGDENAIRAETFMRFVPSVSQLGFSENWAWIPVVPVTDMVGFETEIRKREVPNFSVWQQNDHGGHEPVLWRDFYYPIVYSESLSSEGSLVGFDCGSDPRLRQALDICIRSGLPTGVIPDRPVNGGAEVSNLFVFQPIYTTKSTSRELRGFVLAVVNLNRLLRSSFTPLGSDHRPYVSADIFELATTSRPHLIVSTSQQVRPVESALLTVDGQKLMLASPLFYFGNTYVTAIRAEQAYYDEHPLRLAWATWLVGGVLTLLLAGFVGLLSSRRTDLERQVETRTAELARANQQIVTILDSAGDGILGVDHVGRCTVANLSAAQALGYEIGELIGKPCDALWLGPPAAAPSGNREANPIYATYTYGTTYSTTDAVFYRKNGTSFHVAFVCKPICVQGQVMGAVVTFEDITERRIAEENLHHAYSELANVNSQLREASQAKNRFLAHMSHEIRTPLNCVIGMSGLLMNTTLTEEQQEFAETIRVSGESLLSIVNEILDFSKIEAQKLELEKQPFDLRHCVEDAVDLVAPAAVAKKLELLYMIDETLPHTVIGDVTRLRQILVNLLSNAVKFTERGEVEVTVTGERAGPDQMRLHFSVRDTGIGITPEEQARVFDSFHQCDASTTRRFGGTGLGLAISKRLCELMGGTMTIESVGVSGHGSTFHFSVLMESDPNVREQDLMPYSLTIGKRALIVAANKAGRDVLTRQVKALGMAPTAAASGSEALELLRQDDLFAKTGPFDLAILESKAEGLCGAELAAALRGVRGYEQLHLIMLDALGDRVNGVEAQMFTEHLTKPVKLMPLYDAVARLFATEPVKPHKPGYGHVQMDGELGKQHPLRILIAEDNVVNQKVAASILKKLGYRADIVANGYEAIEAVKSTDYDLVLMDVQMPELDGEDAARMIRRDVTADRQPWIVAMTANVLKEDRERYQMAGMNDYIPKPVRIEHLVNVLLMVQPISIQTGLDALVSGVKRPAVSVHREG